MLELCFKSKGVLDGNSIEVRLTWPPLGAPNFSMCRTKCEVLPLYRHLQCPNTSVFYFFFFLSLFQIYSIASAWCLEPVLAMDMISWRSCLSYASSRARS